MGVFTAVSEVWSEVAQWLVDFFPTVTALFWTPGADGAAGTLTFLGCLAVVGLAISVFLLCMNLVKDFLRLR